jgi:hypothetical protein
MTAAKALKVYLERKDNLAPEGGRKVELGTELRALSIEDRQELGRLAAAELGEEIDSK